MPPTSATRASIRTSRARTSTSTTSRSSARCRGNMGLRVSYIGSTMRKLLVDRDYNTLQASTVPFDPREPDGLRAAAVPALRLLHGHRGQPRRAASSTRCSSSCSRRWQERSRLQRRVHAGALGQQRPGHRQQHDRAGAVRSLRHREGPRSRSQRRRSTASWRMRRGTFPWATAASTARTWRSGRTRCSAAGRSRRSFQARSGQNLTPFFSGFYTTSPWNTGKPLDGLGNFFCCAWRPDQIGDPNSGGSREAFFNQAAYAIPADGKLGNAKKGSLQGPGHLGGELRVLQGRRARRAISGCSSRLLLDNAFNHPQFFPTYGSGFVDLTSFLIDGDPNNGTTGVLGAGAIGNAEGLLARTRHTTRYTCDLLAVRLRCRQFASPALGPPRGRIPPRVRPNRQSSFCRSPLSNRRSVNRGSAIADRQSARSGPRSAKAGHRPHIAPSGQPAVPNRKRL